MVKKPGHDRIESVAALVASVMGVAAVLFVLWGPLYSLESSGLSSDGTVTSTTGTASLLQVGLDPVTAVVLAVALLASLGIGLGGVVHARTGATLGRGLVAASTVALLVVAILGALSIGIFLLPSLALGFVALAAGTIPTSPAAPWPHP
jgi:hypothetical protein